MFETYGYVDVFYVREDGSEKEVSGAWKVEMDSPLFKMVEEEKVSKRKKNQAEKERIGLLLSKYELESLQELILNSIIDEQKKTYLNKWELSQVSNITAIFFRI